MSFYRHIIEECLLKTNRNKKQLTIHSYTSTMLDSNSNSKTLIYKDCSLGLVKNLSNN